MATFNILLLFTCAMYYLSEATVPTLRMNDCRDIPALALGTWLGWNVKPNGTEVEQAVLWAIDAGYTAIDTALFYEVEDQIGRALAKKCEEGLNRDDIFVTSKLWIDSHGQDAVIPALKKSLKDLQLDYVDLYLIHLPLGIFPNGTYDLTDYVDTWRGMIDAKNLGLAKSIGVSNFNQSQIDRLLAQGLETPAALQVEINLNYQQPELLSYCKERKITVMGYTPFGSLFYNKAYPKAPPPRVDDPVLVEIAQKYNKTVPQINLRYMVELGVVPLPKSLNKTHIEENIDIFDFELTQCERDLLKRYDSDYKSLRQCVWSDHPYYPFDRKYC